MKILYRIFIAILLLMTCIIFIVPYCRAFNFQIPPHGESFPTFGVNTFFGFIICIYVNSLCVFFTANLIYNLIIEYESDTYYHSTSRKFLYVGVNNLLHIIIGLFVSVEESVDVLLVFEMIFVCSAFILYPIHRYFVKKQNEDGYEDDTDNDIRAVKIFHFILIIIPIIISGILALITFI